MLIPRPSPASESEQGRAPGFPGALEADIVHRHKKRISAWYEGHKGQIDMDSARRLCSDHEIGLCDHGGARSEPFGTIYSWVAELGTGKIHVAHGRPCENEYKVIELEV